MAIYGKSSYKGRTFLGSARRVGSGQRIVRRRPLPAGVREIHVRNNLTIVR